jgi:hypothetical protein
MAKFESANSWISTTTSTLTYTVTASAGATIDLNIPQPTFTATSLSAPSDAAILVVTAAVAVILDAFGRPQERVTLVPDPLDHPQQNAIANSNLGPLHYSLSSATPQEKALLLCAVLFTAVLLACTTVTSFFYVRKWRKLESGWRATEQYRILEEKYYRDEDRKWQNKKWDEGASLTQQQFRDAVARAAAISTEENDND